MNVGTEPMAGDGILPQSEQKKFPGGLFITLEGLEASGKSTQAKRLKEYFEAQGYETILVGEPGGTVYGKAARELFLSHHRTLSPAAEVGLLLTCKSQLLETIIRPALKRGAVVICDRYTDTLYAYQHHAKNHPKELLDRMVTAFGCDFDPDFVIFYDIPAETSIKRSLERKNQGGEFTDLDGETILFHRSVHNGFLARLWGKPLDSYAIIHSQTAGIDEVTDESLKRINRRIRMLMVERRGAVEGLTDVDA